MPEYEYRCRQCGVFRTADMREGEVTDLWCARCNTLMRHQRWYSFGVGKGSSGEPVRTVRQREVPEEGS